MSSCHLSGSSASSSADPFLALVTSAAASMTDDPSGECDSPSPSFLCPVPRSPRLGPSYQADIPELQPKAEPLYNTESPHSDATAPSISSDSSSVPPSLDGIPQFLFSRLRPPVKNLDHYLSAVENLFQNPRQFSEEKALHFLHLCEYNVGAALKLLKPWPEPSEEEEGNEGSEPSVELYPADDFCFVCRDGGDLILCDVAGCKKVYHPACVKLEAVPEGKWRCPYHQCTVCAEPVEPELEPEQSAAQDANGAKAPIVPQPLPVRLKNYADRVYALFGVAGQSKRIAQNFPIAPRPHCDLCPTAWCATHFIKENLMRNYENRLHEYLCPICLEKEKTDSIDKSGNHSDRRAFLKRVQHCLKREGKQLAKIPILGRRELDLPLLYRTVISLGGIHSVIHHHDWGKVRRRLGYSSAVEDIKLNLKKYYFSILYSYEKQFFVGFQPVSAAAAHSLVDVHADEESDEEETQAKKKKAKANEVKAEELYDRDDSPEDIVVVIAKFAPPPKPGEKSGASTAAAKEKEKKAPVPRARTMTAKPVKVQKRGRGRPSNAAKAAMAAAAIQEKKKGGKRARQEEEEAAEEDGDEDDTGRTL